jgi:hypothetical protein
LKRSSTFNMLGQVHRGLICRRICATPTLRTRTVTDTFVARQRLAGRRSIREFDVLVEDDDALLVAHDIVAVEAGAEFVEIVFALRAFHPLEGAAFARRTRQADIANRDDGRRSWGRRNSPIACRRPEDRLQLAHARTVSLLRRPGLAHAFADSLALSEEGGIIARRAGAKA